MARYAGRKGLVYIGTTSGGVATAVSTLKKWSLNRETDKLDVTCFLDSNKVYVQGLPDVKGTFEGVWDDTDTKVFTAAAATGAVNMYLYPSQDALTKYAYGIAWLDASIDVGVNDAIMIKGSFVAGGSWTVSL